MTMSEKVQDQGREVEGLVGSTHPEQPAGSAGIAHPLAELLATPGTDVSSTGRDVEAKPLRQQADMRPASAEKKDHLTTTEVPNERSGTRATRLAKLIGLGELLGTTVQCRRRFARLGYELRRSLTRPEPHHVPGDWSCRVSSPTTVTVNTHRHTVERLSWALVYGELPVDQDARRSCRSA